MHEGVPFLISHSPVLGVTEYFTTNSVLSISPRNYTTAGACTILLVFRVGCPSEVPFFGYLYES